uniref:Uncharacterized protein n=1 Tax=Meloidogyne enterolobii TaxID=390850 RepID=A0A6V7V0Z2_MELEN|nr:unnamed protein product [Meloidogyne enterolobii]
MKGIKYISFTFPSNTKYEKYELVLRPRTSYFSLFLASYMNSYSYFVPGTSTNFSTSFEALPISHFSVEI